MEKKMREFTKKMSTYFFIIGLIPFALVIFFIFWAIASAILGADAAYPQMMLDSYNQQWTNPEFLVFYCCLAISLIAKASLVLFPKKA